MRYHKALLCVVWILLNIGCQSTNLQPGTEGFEGSWICEAGVLRGFRDSDGHLVFKFVKQSHPYEPVFSNCSIRGNRIEIRFRLVTYHDGSDSGQKLKFVLTRGDGVLEGKLLQSGREPADVVLKKYHNYSNMAAFEGTWFHSLSAGNKERAIILRGFRDNNGRVAFAYLRQHYSYEPVFTECSFKKKQIEIKFKLTSYSQGHDSKHTVRYVLTEANGVLHGQLFQSWKEPQEVILVRVTRDAFSNE
jgi:hypothetical protein